MELSVCVFVFGYFGYYQLISYPLTSLNIKIMEALNHHQVGSVKRKWHIMTSKRDQKGIIDIS